MSSKRSVGLTPERWAYLKALRAPAARLVWVSKPLVDIEIAKGIFAPIVSPEKGRTFENEETKLRRYAKQNNKAIDSLGNPRVEIMV